MARGDQPRWPRGTPVGPSGKGPGGGRFRDAGPSSGRGSGAGSWIDRLLSRFRRGDAPEVPASTTPPPGPGMMADIQRRVASGEKLDIDYGGEWLPVVSSEIDTLGNIRTLTGEGGSGQSLELRHSPYDVLRTRPAGDRLAPVQDGPVPEAWARRISDTVGQRRERMDEVQRVRGENTDPGDEFAAGTRVTDPSGAEGIVTVRYRRGGLEMAQVEYDGAPGEPQDWEIVDLRRR